MTIPIWPIIGGLLIGSSAVLLLWLLGRTAGISSITWNAVFQSGNERFWQMAFIVGLAIGAYSFHALSGVAYPRVNEDPQLAIAAGLLVGFGVKLGNGCTSGHGVCGIGRLSKRSIIATLVFMSVAVLTVFLVKTVMGAQMNSIKILLGLLAGSVFGMGLAASGMTNTAKVIGFLDVTGNWDPDLVWVMGSAVLVTLIGFHRVLKLPKPTFAEQFTPSNMRGIDAKLVLGAGIFGIGWGLYGYCPGPAIASLIYQSPTTALFVLSMLLGMALSNWLTAQLSKQIVQSCLGLLLANLSNT